MSTSRAASSDELSVSVTDQAIEIRWFGATFRCSADEAHRISDLLWEGAIELERCRTAIADSSDGACGLD
ncbi:MAG: hypothetical protein C0461_11830 [Brevundimonas sp.]|nr:hypothetical protein [Brevundimonas sp.]